MEYYNLLQLDREPFSNSPDPDYFFQSGEHLVCLQRLELALRLKRGLNVVIGDVGTGKTTICRQLLRTFSADPDVEAYLILDPSFSTAHDFTRHIYERVCDLAGSSADPSDLEMKEWIKQSLFAKGVDQSKTIVLIIDEGQKITPACVEILRELLNYETNTFKLLQIAIFAQLEFEEVLNSRANFTDRINMLHYLQPMNFKDTRKMVLHRLKLASTTARPKKLFTFPAMWAIYRASKGYPRKIIHICHQSMLALIIQNRTQAGWALIRSCTKRTGLAQRNKRRALLFGLAAVIGLSFFIGFVPDFFSPNTTHVFSRKITLPATEPIAPAGEAPAADKVSLSTESATSEPAQQSPSRPESEPPASQVMPITIPVSAHAAVGAMDSGTTVDRGPKEPQLVPSPFAPAIKPPQLLGQLVVKPGDTIIGLVRSVYGTNRNKYLRAVVEANPHVPDPNAIEIGQTISFPALQSKAYSVKGPYWWIILDQQPSLQAAMHRILEIKSSVRLPLQLIPNWSPQSGVRFQIGLKGYYTSEDEALDINRKLPQQLAARSQIVSSWPPDTIFYSNPAAGGIQHHQTTDEALN